MGPQIIHHTYVHENVKKFIDGFHHDAHPMGILVSTLAALSTFYPEPRRSIDRAKPRRAGGAADRQDADARGLRLPARAGAAVRLSRRRAVLRGQLPEHDVEDDRAQVHPDPVLEHALDVLFILHADHEQNCSTSAMRAVGSSHVDPYSAAAAAAAALYGPLHGGANEQVLRCCARSAPWTTYPAYIDRVKRGRAAADGVRPPGVQELRPAGAIIKQVADEVFEVTGRNPLLDIALELERIALAGRLLHQPQALPERGLLLGHHLPGHGLPGGDVPGAVRDRPRCPAGSPMAGELTDRSRRSPGRGRSTSARACATWTGRMTDRIPRALAGRGPQVRGWRRLFSEG